MAQLSITLPVVGGDEDGWGTILNTALGNIDTWAGTVDSAELAQLAGMTATTAELNILDGLTATTVELNQLDGVTLGGLASVDVIDEDDFASDSAIRPPSQQSTGAYIATQLSGVPRLLATHAMSGTANFVFDSSNGLNSTLYYGYEFYFSVQTGSENIYLATSQDGSTFDIGSTDYSFERGGSASPGSATASDPVLIDSPYSQFTGKLTCIEPELAAFTVLKGEFTGIDLSLPKVSPLGIARNTAAATLAFRFSRSPTGSTGVNWSSGTIWVVGLPR